MKKYILIIIFMLFIIPSVYAEDIDLSCTYIPLYISNGEEYYCSGASLATTTLNFHFLDGARRELVSYTLSHDGPTEEGRPSSMSIATREKYSRPLYDFMAEQGDNYSCADYPSVYCGYLEDDETLTCTTNRDEFIGCNRDDKEDYKDNCERAKISCDIVVIYRYISSFAYDGDYSGYVTYINHVYKSTNNHTYTVDDTGTTTSKVDDQIKPGTEGSSSGYRKCCDSSGQVQLVLNSYGLCKNSGYTDPDSSNKCPSEYITPKAEVPAGTPICESSTMTEFQTFMDEKVMLPLRIGAVIIFLILTTVDYSKVIFDKEASPKKANSRLFKRLIAILILFFANEIVRFITTILGMGC